MELSQRSLIEPPIVNTQIPQDGTRRSSTQPWTISSVISLSMFFAGYRASNLTNFSVFSETSFVSYKFELVVRDNCVSSRRWTPVLQTAVNFTTTEVDAPSAAKSSSSIDFEISHCENWGLARFNSEGRTIPYDGVLSLPPATPGMIASTWKTRFGRDGRTEWVSCMEVQIPAEMFSGRESTHFRIDAEVDCECLGSCITVVAESATARMDRHEDKILFRELC